ncbi:MAG: hypothetical protein FJ008_06425 [Chloroflexi bacterium]|nr:hypothetical protein [Chloroflexota bacterium]MBM3172113.1 hypothetical protein [Chloroflexota bacterium]MBM3175006.1 hypothetical protein [Chloroflexota bacterium]MBM4449368.1 hypothetical protein [Chloroflexota bacterium]
MGFKTKRKPVAKNKREFIRNGQKSLCKNYAKCGQSLKRGGHLHHKNGNPSDNRYENLVLLCTKCHKEMTRIQREKRAKERKKLPRW